MSRAPATPFPGAIWFMDSNASPAATCRCNERNGARGSDGVQATRRNPGSPTGSPGFWKRSANMRKMKRVLWPLWLSALAACVTVNVYFPAAAVERIVKEVYGARAEQQKQQEEKKQPPAGDKQSDAAPATPSAPSLAVLLDGMIVPAQAQAPDIDVSSPAINKLKGAMQARHQQLVPYYNSGAVGMTSNGLLALRDPKAVSLKERGVVSQLVAAENEDRNALYAEISRANGHPEWEREVRTIFDRRWVANAPGGWWFQNANGDWVQK